MDRREFNARFTLLDCLQDSDIRSFSAVSNGRDPVAVHLLPPAEDEAYRMLFTDLDRLRDLGTDGLEVFDVSGRTIVVSPRLRPDETLEAWVMERLAESAGADGGDSYGLLLGGDEGDTEAPAVRIGTSEPATSPTDASEAGSGPASTPAPSAGGRDEGGLTEFLDASDVAAIVDQGAATPPATPSPPSDDSRPIADEQPVEEPTAEEADTAGASSEGGGGGLTGLFDAEPESPGPAEPPAPTQPPAAATPREVSGAPPQETDGLTILMSGLGTGGAQPRAETPRQPRPQATEDRRPTSGEASPRSEVEDEASRESSGLTGHFDAEFPGAAPARPVPETSMPFPASEGSPGSAEDRSFSELDSWQVSPKRKPAREQESSGVGLHDYMERLSGPPSGSPSGGPGAPASPGPITPFTRPGAGFPCRIGLADRRRVRRQSDVGRGGGRRRWRIEPLETHDRAIRRGRLGRPDRDGGTLELARVPRLTLPRRAGPFYSSRGRSTRSSRWGRRIESGT